MRFGEWVGLWTKGAEKYPNFGYLIKVTGGTLGGTRIVAMDFCYHGNHCVAMATKKCLETHRTPLSGSVATPLTRPSERVKALVLVYWSNLKKKCSSKQ